MSQRPLVSCVIAVKGKRPYFDAALASLRAQGLGDDLEIIVQDADVDPDKGQSDAFNKGFAKARGEWFFWLNADDVMLPHALERVKSVIDSNGGSVSWVSGNLVYIDREDHILRCARERGTKNSYEGFPVRVYGPSSFFRRELFEAVGGFDLTCRFSMDIDFESVAAALKKINYKGWYTLEADTYLNDCKTEGETIEGIKRLAEAARRFEALCK